MQLLKLVLLSNKAEYFLNNRSLFHKVKMSAHFEYQALQMLLNSVAVTVIGWKELGQNN